MPSRSERISAASGVLAVCLWVGGFLLAQAFSHPPADNAGDARMLAWMHDKSTLITSGGWLFMIGCAAFVWFAASLRSRLAAAEGGTGTLSALILASGTGAGLFAMGFPAGDLAGAINNSDLSPAAAGALHQSSTIFFLITELAAVVLLAAVGVLALRTRMLPRWWAAVCLLLAVVLLVGPIGWLGVIVGMPVWTLVTSLLLALRPQQQADAAAAPVPTAA